jgi:hypothetical protein
MPRAAASVRARSMTTTSPEGTKTKSRFAKGTSVLSW